VIWSGSPPSESADPEDVRMMLAAYFEMARNRIESFGVVEKFIGDAVVGIFGVPAAHEDDPERAVRAGIRIAEDAEELEGIGGGTASPLCRHQHRRGAGSWDQGVGEALRAMNEALSRRVAGLHRQASLRRTAVTMEEPLALLIGQ
jgi:class 3 adenylate cyclase